MIVELMIGVGAVTAGGFTCARRRRVRLYRELGERLARIVSAQAPNLGASWQRETPRFADRLAVVPDLLPAEIFSTLKAESERLVTHERSLVPTHKKGGTVAYETLIASAPAIAAFYHCAELHDFIARIVGVRVQPTPIHDQSSLSVLFYDRPGDHIGWHYDHNFYRGRHFTVLIAMSNEGRAADGLSHAQLRARLTGREIAETPLILVARKDLPANNLQEFIAYAKANQAKMQLRTRAARRDCRRNTACSCPTPRRQYNAARLSCR
jgi:hypothetical protein